MRLARSHDVISVIALPLLADAANVMVIRCMGGKTSPNQPLVDGILRVYTLYKVPGILPWVLK